MPNWAAMSFHAFLLVHCNKGGVKRGIKDVLSAVLFYIEFYYICTDSMRVHHRTLRSSYSQILPKLIPNVKPGTPGPAPTSRKPPRSLVKM